MSNAADILGDSLDGMENAVVTERLPKITPGNYTLSVDKLTAIKSRKGDKFFIGTFNVLESSGEGAIGAGQKCVHMIKLSLDSAKGNVRGLISAVLNEPPTSVTKQVTQMAISDDQPAKGTVVKAYAHTTIKKDGNPFTLVDYSPVSTTATAAPKKGARSST